MVTPGQSAYERPVYTSPFHRAYTDLRTKQYHYVKLTTNGVEAISAATDDPFGILQNQPDAGEGAEVMIIGTSPVVCGGTITPGASIGPDATGKAVARVPGTDTTKYVGGKSEQAGVADQLIAALVNCASTHHAS